MKTMDKMIEEKLLATVRGAVCFPDDVESFLMPLIREAIDEWQQENMHQMSIKSLELARAK